MFNYFKLMCYHKLMIKIKNKKQSINLINQMGLNSMPQEVFSKENLARVKRFFEKNPAKEYVVRDIFTPMGKYALVKNFDECEKYVSTIPSNKFSLAVSFNDLERILLGDILVKDNFVTLSASTSPSANHRNIYNNPEISLSCELFEDKLWNVPGFEKIIDYINQHNLFDVVVEFAIFKNKVGTHRDNVVIIELRSDY